jgi:uncharacterized membrane protein
MYALQLRIYDMFRAMKWATPFMTSKWGWPFCETVHFLGLSLLIGTIGMFDLRLLGIGRRIPIRALHKLVPWGVSGYILAVITGIMFLATEPDQYIFNPAFQWKVLFMAVAGLNMATFYAVVFRRVSEHAKLPAKLIAALSLFLWIGVIVFGRMLTFYRPADCGSNLAPFISTCIPLR